MIKISRAVIVEGKYDKIKLANIIDGFIVETNGFSIYKDKEKSRFIKKLADERGLIVITDSDHSGFMIRSYINKIVNNKDKVKNIYIPDVLGKEKRKSSPSKEGKLGVEGIDDKTLTELFNEAGIASSLSDKSPDDMITSYDLYAAGISGGNNSKENRKKLLKALNLPEFLSASSLLSYLNSVMTLNEFNDYISTI